VEEPISIAGLKRFVGDLALDGKAGFSEVIQKATGKKIAVVGGGPGGLAAAYFLRKRGHGVTVYDFMPEMGGMLRYGIPEYRLPKKLLSGEVAKIEEMGVSFKNNIKIGTDIKLEELSDSHDAIIVAVGAWESVPLRCPGEELDGVLGGIDFLRGVAMGEKNEIYGKRVAVVGGGNTAMDACRTAVRLGAAQAYNIYRRTINEMPAEQSEIKEAKEEGVLFKNLTNPIEIIGEGGKVKAVRLQVMELGAPDASGRRSPMPVFDKEEEIKVDFVIIAIGQKLNNEGLSGVELTKLHTISADSETFMTSLDGVFAIGDASNKGADIAVSAIGEAKKAALMVERYINGENLKYRPQFLMKDEKTAVDFLILEKKPRQKPHIRSADERKKDFAEVEKEITVEQAKREANRCLECGCQDYFECKLLEYANKYDVDPKKYDGEKRKRVTASDIDNPYIKRNPDKCIVCGLCVRICEEAVGASALGLAGRGFDTEVIPALGLPFSESGCIFCGQCVSVCPTGALTEAVMCEKPMPLKEIVTLVTCPFCTLKCGVKLTSCGDLILRSLPIDDNSFLCKHGRFGFGKEYGINIEDISGYSESPKIRAIREAETIAVVDVNVICEIGAVAMMEANRAARKGAKLIFVEDKKLPTDLDGEKTVIICGGGAKIEQADFIKAKIVRIAK
jgi:formate dehydrogenase major subunit